LDHDKEHEKSVHQKINSLQNHFLKAGCRRHWEAVGLQQKAVDYRHRQCVGKVFLLLFLLIFFEGICF